MIATQTAAIFLDAYRELNARRLFWLTLILSGVAVLAFAAVGINETGLTVLHWELGIGPNTALIPADIFYKFVFVTLGVRFWLTWGATILALLSTASIIPDFISAGGIDITLSKPIGRLRLFLTKYVAALTFVALQAAVFSAASFFIIGLRGGSWEPTVFLAIPLVILVFSYLYAVCALVGLLTRSTIAALLATMLFWLAIFATHATENALLAGKTMFAERTRSLEARVAEMERGADQPAETGNGVLNTLRSGLSKEREKERLERWRSEAEEARKISDRLTGIHRWALAVKTVLPKTAETTELLSRSLIDTSDLPGMRNDDPPGPMVQFEVADEPGEDDGPPPPGMDESERQAQRMVVEQIRARSWVWVIGTSLLFEALIVGIAAWRFCRRDF